MTTMWSELGDLAVLLAIVCVPIAVAAIAIPLGRAIANRVDRRDLRNIDLEAVEQRVSAVDERLAALEESIASMSLQVERIGEQQRFLAKLLGPSSDDSRSQPASSA